jgi:hypothetical protein
MAIEIHFEKRVHNSAVVREVDARQRRQHVFLTFLGGLFILALLFYGWQQYRFLTAGYRMELARAEFEKLSQARDRLTVQRDSLGSLDRVGMRARRDLGMIEPPPGHWISLAPDDTHADPFGVAPPELALNAGE